MLTSGLFNRLFCFYDAIPEISIYLFYIFEEINKSCLDMGMLLKVYQRIYIYFFYLCWKYWYFYFICKNAMKWSFKIKWAKMRGEFSRRDVLILLTSSLFSRLFCFYDAIPEISIYLFYIFKEINKSCLDLSILLKVQLRIFFYLKFVLNVPIFLFYL